MQTSVHPKGHALCGTPTCSYALPDLGPKGYGLQIEVFNWQRLPSPSEGLI